MVHLRNVLIKGLKIVGYPSLGLVAYWGLVLGTQVYSNKNSPEITSDSQLERVIRTEKEYLDCNKSIIPVVFERDMAESVKFEIRPWLYHLRIGGGSLNESVVSHETYHICDGHLDNEFLHSNEILADLVYIFWYEPKATIYQIRRLKL